MQQPPTHTQPVSIASTFREATVLLTGATGFVGSLLLEALLRTTDVQRVYVLLRPKGGDSPQARLEKLLQTRVFHKVRDDQALLSKAHPLQGDITSPALGLSHSNSQALHADVHVILHAAADIRLEAGIHTALTANCLGTQAVLALARGCRQLRALVHTSSCFVNMHLPASSVVEERVYPLSWGGRRVEPEALIQDLMCLPPAAADDRACALGRRWGFPNNYTLSKHLAEQLVAQAAAEHRLPVCIVRPSLVTAVLYEPIPGHIDGWAGPSGASAAIALGSHHSRGCVSSQPLHVWDVMPAGLVVNAVLASAAAAAAAGGAAGSIAPSSSSSEASPMLILHSSSSSSYPLTLMEGWNAALEFLAAHPPKLRLCRGLPARMTPAFQPDPAVVRRHRRWTAFKVWAACWLLRLLSLRRAAARLQSGFEALCVYGTSKTDRDLTFSAAALEALERRLPPAESAAHPLVMRPGMRLPSVLASSAGGRGSSSSSSGAPLVAATPSSSSSSSSSSSAAAEQGVLTWRRYFHTQLAAVCSALFQVKVPRAAAGCVEHDFVFIR